MSLAAGHVLGEWLVAAVTMTSGVDDVFRVNGQEVFSGDLLVGTILSAFRRKRKRRPRPGKAS